MVGRPSQRGDRLQINFRLVDAVDQPSSLWMFTAASFLERPPLVSPWSRASCFASASLVLRTMGGAVAFASFIVPPTERSETSRVRTSQPAPRSR